MRTGVALASLLAVACAIDAHQAPAALSPEREQLLAECKAWCDSLPDCPGGHYASRQGCRAGCDPNEPADACVTSAVGVYRCMRESGYDCKNELRFPRDECSEAFALREDCEDLAATPQGGERLRAACSERCQLVADCSGVADDAECARSCNDLVANTFAECVPEATAAHSCSNKRGSECRDGQFVPVTPDPCQKERLASEACHHRMLVCRGADATGKCPPVSCSCGGVPFSITEPVVYGKWCRCPAFNDCNAHCS